MTDERNQPSTEARVWPCDRCGMVNSDGDKKCPNCGHWRPPMTDERQPDIFANDEEAIELLMWAVNLGAVAHNALMELGAVEEPLPRRLIQKMHDLRRALNDPRKHALRMAYLNAWERVGHEVSRSNREAPRYEIGPDFQNKEIKP